MSFRVKLFFIFLMYGLLLAIAAQILMMKINKEVVRQDSLKKAALYAEEIQKDFQQNLKASQRKLKAIRESKIFQKNFQENRIRKCSELLFLDIAKTSSDIMQLRYIDKNGNEVIRVERNNPRQEAYIIDRKYLQNKAQRYYFKELMQLRDGEYWYSKLDLNVEHGKIEEPLKPVIRIGTPYYYKGERKGILIINVFVNDFLHSLVESDIYNVFLIDKDNYMLVNTQHKNEWSRYLDKENGKNLESLLDVKSENSYILNLKITNNEGLKIILVPKENYIAAEVKENFYQFLWVVLIVLILSLPLSYFMSILPAKLKSKVDALNKELENEAKDKDILLSLFDLSDAVLFKWNNDEKWSVSFVSKSVENLLEYSQNDFASNKVAYINCIHSSDIARVEQEVQAAIKVEAYFFTHEPYRIVTKNKKIKWILDNTVIVRDENGEIINFVGYLTDVTELKEKEFELENLARIDQLTKINNRLYLDEILMKQYYRFNRHSEECSIILVDIDYFKTVNDEYGHLVGDKVLVEFAALLQKSIRKDDIVGRWGGEEFLIILPHTYLDKAAFLAEKLCKIIAEHEFNVIGHKTASFGVATFVHGMSVEQCVDMADDALYEAKEGGRNMVKVAKQA
ncbi:MULTISPECIES: sensor domain-containing diguanylate cyclase [Sulfurimonas]|uniref:sensor domain-containing diguanylate cyclase n=1 Tax=Sulfurimonas TaxID=202746 RepID=UPI001FE72FD2|nr:sensor domain-containing diguanylate cyclase [Sulfurimonas indica]